ncbi:hypothetical protein [Mesorhizobium delmotii]|uniref:hypothetical protein n=1 Tax=Mesorhizobium delmotii TaxID=1631247 RepID=UPI001FCE44B7|nr:hypothetical protein [Mesorhizobium delmotii]
MSSRRALIAVPVVWLLAAAGVIEAAMGVALIVVPSTVAVLLLGDGLTGTGLTVARVTGVALLAGRIREGARRWREC